MAQLVLTVGGQLAGSAFGPIGAAVGGALGAAAYQEFFAPEPPGQVGPQFSDGQITSSAYGQAIPEIYGTMPVGGNIIDAGPIETDKNTSGGGSSKGGPKEPKITTFTHYADLDVLIGAGEITALLKIWVNEQLIYDSTEGATIVQPSWLNFRFYSGGAGQEADPTFETIHGADGTPAYQGLSHVVFSRFKLDEFDLGERIALQFKFLVSRNGTYDAAEVIYDTADYESTADNVVDLLWAEQPDLMIVAIETTASTNVDTHSLQAINPYTHEMAWTRNYPGGTNEGAINNIAVGSIPIEYQGQSINVPGAQLIYTGGHGGTSTEWVEIADAETGSIRTHGEFSDEYPPNWIVSPRVDRMTLYRLPQTDFGQGLLKRMDWVGLNYSETTIVYPWTDQTVTQPTGWTVDSGNTPATDGEGLLLFGFEDGSSNIGVLVVNDDDLISSGALTLEGQTPTTLSAASGIQSLQYDKTQEAFWVLCDRTADSNMQLYKIATDGTIADNWNVSTDIGIAGNVSFGDILFGIDNFRGRLVFAKSSNIYAISTADPTQLLETYTAPSSTEPGGVMHPYTSRFYAGGSGTTEEYVHIIQLNAGASGSETLKNVVDGIAAFGNSHLTASDYDNTALASTTVNGFMMARPGMAKSAAINMLRATYLFDLVPRDGVITALLRGTGSSAITLDDDTIGAHIDGSARATPLTITKVNPEQLPRATEVDYINPDQNYERGSQQSRRLATAAGVGTTEKTSLTVALTDDEGAELADVLLHAAHIESERYLVRAMPSTADDVQPGALVTIDYAGETYIGRVEQADIIDGMIVDARILRTDNSIYTAYSVGGTVRNTGATVYAIGTAILIPIDAPAIRTEDFDSGYYVAAYSQTDSWPGAEVFRSTDSANYSAVAQVLEASTVGVVRAVTDTFRAMHYQTQRTISLELLAGGPLVSLSLSDFESTNDNAFAIGRNGRWVYGRFLTATENADDSWTLSGLVLGLQGTESDVESIAVNDRFVMLDATKMDRISLSTAAIGGVDYLKPVTLGRNIDESPLVTQAPTGEALKPFAPYDLHATGFGSDITLTWVRRDKLWTRPFWQTAMSEDSESYTIDILDSDLASVRTLTATSETATYTSAQQTTDFGGTITYARWRVAQVSAQVGAGEYTYAASGSRVGWQNYVLTFSPLAFLRFEEAVGAGTILDYSGNARNATNPDNYSLLRIPGPFGFGMDFSELGVNGETVDFGTVTALNQVNNGDFTFMAWVELKAGYVNNTVGSLVNQTNGFDCYFADNGGSLEMLTVITYTTTTARYYSTALGMTAETTHLITVTHDSTAKTTKIYIDDAEVASYSLSTAGAGTAINGTSFTRVGSTATKDLIVYEWALIPSELSAADVVTAYGKLTE